ncbi:MAG: UDP-N-acetylmuramoyl-L-alanyl-D-glutamate--2,6-diaminopimelate ligase [Spirochaetales bacterium]|nr:UDP-N-acetylmuramoyl-L-alanyl-D-glutamate--2,6-diaminopimelate ligase [Spirochaetales bacterium]MCF7937859.1 UDP-N-acetylmuramoyl-L-alanyl-D-glutamate--2,6-diaminopimelate ligase [Spirochaetales bacterium]
MVSKSISKITTGCNISDVHGDLWKKINGISYDSRRTRPGDLFVALPGIHTDGKNFIRQAVDAGASAVLYQGEPPQFLPGITYLQTDNTRREMSKISAALFDYPGEKLELIGVTGTDGKSSTVSFIHQLLTSLGQPTGYLSTVAYDAGDGTESNPFRQSTPEAPEIQQILARMYENGCRYAVIEATSHGLSPRTSRLEGLRFRTAVFTNISHEHLEFHGSYEQYRRDKGRLFAALREDGFGVVNGDHQEAGFFVQASSASVYRYGREINFDLSFRSVSEGLAGSRLYLKALSAGSGQESLGRLSIPGDFFVENAAAAVLTVHKLTGRPLSDIAERLQTLRPVPGRMETLRMGQTFTVLIDYAHTPGAFSRLLPAVRHLTPGRCITVFGSAGERDTRKRRLQGEIADTYSDIIILTDEDPRGEDSMAIIREIADACSSHTENKDLFLIPDRKTAIQTALGIAAKGDTVLLLGKGHEGSIQYSTGSRPWDEAETARSLLKDIMKTTEENSE